MTTPSKLAIASSQASSECCMCGDFGLSSELFQCKICQFRSQHRYCSNLYPKVESYQVCNWCLSDQETKEKSQNSSNSSSSNRNSSEEESSKNKKLKNQRGNNPQLQVIGGPIKKQRSPERSPVVTTRRRLISNGKLEEKLIRRTKSEEIANNNGIIKQVFRNKVRRYKLLDEVSS